MRVLWVSLKIAWRTLMVNKVRSILTLSGMIIGVGAVIAIVSLGEGLRADFTAQMSNLGTDVFYMTPKSPKRPGQAPRAPRLFTMEDIEAVEEGSTIVRQIEPGILAGAIVKYRDKTRQSTINGVLPNYLNTSATAELKEGRFFNEAEFQASARVLIIGDDIADELFESWEDPIGEFIKVSGSQYKIIGRFKSYSGMVQEGGSLNDSFAAPISTVQRRLIGSKDVYWVSLYMETGGDLEAAKEEVSIIMRQRHRIRNAADDDFQFISPDDFLEMGNQFINVLVGVFGAVAFISLMVGGVGIMNIMLVSVTERTREIGLRMAMGANRPTLMTQFLVEAIMLTVIGGVIGLLAGYAGSLGVSALLNNLLEAQWKPTVPAVWVGYAVGVSVLVGVIFGVYPAYKASQLDPVEAMGYE